MANEPIVELMRTLIANGFHLDAIRRLPQEVSILSIHKFDLFEVRINYSVLLAPKKPPQSSITAFTKLAERTNSNPIGIGDLKDVPFKSFTQENFYPKLGGPINSSLVLNPHLSQILNDLGHNKLPSGLNGDADDLLEDYVKECLQFLLNQPAYRYGHERSFESLPDGVAFGENKLVIYFDSKAYASGYSISADDIKRFTSYIDDYNRKYAPILGKLFAFVVATGTFNQTTSSLDKKARELYSKCQTNLCCVKASELGNFVRVLSGNLKYRSSVDWKSLFSLLSPSSKDLQKQLKTIIKDRLV